MTINQITPTIIQTMVEDWIGNNFHVLSPGIFLLGGVVIRTPTKIFAGRPVYCIWKGSAFLGYQFNFRGQSKQFDKLRSRNLIDIITANMVDLSKLNNANHMKLAENSLLQIKLYNNKEMSGRYNGLLIPKRIDWQSETLDLEQINSFLTYYDGNAVSHSGSVNKG